MREYSKTDKKLFETMSIVILSPMYIVEPAWVRSMANMVAYSWMQGLKVYQLAYTNRMVVDWARNSLARSAVEKKSEYTGTHYSHFLWLDVDHVFNPDLACELARHFTMKEVDAVSALYFSRTGPTLPVAYVKDDSANKYKHYPLIEVPPCLCEVDAFGFGATLQKREIYEITPEPWFTIDARAGEDIAFCVHAKEHGFRFWLDGAYKLGHVGEPPIITEEHYRKHLAENAEEYKDKIKVSLDGGRYG